ncbi:ABC transporter ATP-binding protein [Actinoplanes sp. HUAS TT8]|uniref:ABC transporter ATP-binding protein n=1 Tax=Actinoplanes sp. HUAS TT8 TaxID=3447453 RepID=UPI003F523D6C
MVERGERLGRFAVELKDIRKVYGTGRGQVVALDGLSADFERGTFTAVMGPSGSGKSTFLHCAAGLEHPTSGDVALDGISLTTLKERALTDLRLDRIGFVFQSLNLLDSLTVAENITLSEVLGGRRLDRQWITEVVARVGLTDRVRHRPSQLSGGQQQRVAIARALVTKPSVIFADEPTGALDSRTARTILGLIRSIVDSTNQTVIMVTHDPVAAAYADTVVFLADGRVAGSLTAPTVDAVAERMMTLGAWAESGV